MIAVYPPGLCGGKLSIHQRVWPRRTRLHTHRDTAFLRVEMGKASQMVTLFSTRLGLRYS